ncbi:MAG: 2,4-dihydroxyhept-2-ene-1,7-dioic acid aldolase [Thermaceae bacterium]|nr:2,4-dihydroxyhept-2-ene-1,7-dioic acid aldolase [Thermaceae bacterium]
MRINRVQQIWQQGGVAYSGWLSIPSAFSAELMAQAGFDALTLDLQHGLLDFGSSLQMLQAISLENLSPLARVPWNEPGLIMKLLDAGAAGIICPMINSQAEAEAFVSACRYPPQGYRSYGPTRASLVWGSDYGAKANQTILTLAMIETAQGLEALESILDTPGLDGIFVGPNDLGLATGRGAGLDREQADFLEILGRIAQAAHNHGVMPGIYCGSAKYAQRMVTLGYRFIAVSSDARLLSEGARSLVAALKGSVAGQTQGY